MARHSFSLLLMAVLGIALAFAGCKSRTPTSPGILEGKFSGCPDSPNCVSTESSDSSHAIAPLTFNATPGDALDCLKRIITSMKRTTIIQIESNYILAEFRTALGFVDDVEFYFDGLSSTIQMRSASRVGYWDLGVNRKRLEEIRSRFNRECG